MSDFEKKQMQALDAQIALQLKQAQTEFWKVGIAVAIAGAVVRGLLVQVFGGS